MRRTNPLSPTEADLYYFLLQESNIRGWQNPFECSNGLVCGILGIREKTLIRARKRLQKKGFIRFRSGERRRRSPSYQIIYNVADIQVDKTVGDETSTKLNLPSKNKHKAFLKPKVDEIHAYCSERKNSIDPQRFYDFYESKNWMVGKNKMCDWRAAVRNWERRAKDDRQTKGHNITNHDNERNYEEF